MNILEISLLSNDISATKSFYKDLLGLKILKDDPDSVSFSAGQTTLTFNHIGGLDPVYHFAFNIPSNQLYQAMEYVQKRKDILPVSENGELIADFTGWNAKSFYFNDENGNILECIARFDLNNETQDWNPDSFILNISEIAFVVSDVPEAANMLHQRGIPLFPKGPQSSDFSVLGDNHGLIILKDIKGGWMPNNLTPHPFETKALIQQDHLKFTLTLTDHLQIRRSEMEE